GLLFAGHRLAREIIGVKLAHVLRRLEAEASVLARAIDHLRCGQVTGRHELGAILFLGGLHRLAHGGQRGLLERIRLLGLLLTGIEARAGRNELTDDDVLLQATQVVDLAVDRGFGQDARRLLEGGRREERIRLERRLGDTEQHRHGRRRLTALRQHLVVLRVELEAVNRVSLEEIGVARVLDLHLAEHLAADHLDVLVVGVHALRAIHLLHFIDDVALRLLGAERVQDLVRVLRTVSQLRARQNLLAILDQDLVADVDRELLNLFAHRTHVKRRRVEEEGAVDRGEQLVAVRAGGDRGLVLDHLGTLGDRDLPAFRQLLVPDVLFLRDDRQATTKVVFLDANHARLVRHERRTLRLTGLDELLNTRETRRDVGAGHATGVERAHRQLRTRLTDRLRGDHADGLTETDNLTGREVTAVAHTAGAVLSLALHDRADVYAVDAGVDDLAHDVAVRAILVRDELGELLVATRDDLARLWVDQVCRKHATGQPGAVLVRSQLRAVGVVAARPHTGFRAAVVERDDHVLRHVDQSTRQVPGVGGTDGRVREPLAGAVRRKEVLENREALAEVRLDRDVDDLPARIEH